MDWPILPMKRMLFPTLFALAALPVGARGADPSSRPAFLAKTGGRSSAHESSELLRQIKKDAPAILGRAIPSAALKLLERYPGHAAYLELFSSGALRFKFVASEPRGKFAYFGSYRDPEVIFFEEPELNATIAALRAAGIPEGKLLEAAALLWLPNLIHETRHKIHYEELKSLTGMAYPPDVREDELTAYAAQCAFMAAMAPKDLPRISLRGERNGMIQDHCAAGKDSLKAFVARAYSVGSVNEPESFQRRAALAREFLGDTVKSLEYRGRAREGNVSPTRPDPGDRPSDLELSRRYYESLVRFWESPEIIALVRDYYRDAFEDFSAAWLH